MILNYKYFLLYAQSQINIINPLSHGIFSSVQSPNLKMHYRVSDPNSFVHSKLYIYREPTPEFCIQFQNSGVGGQSSAKNKVLSSVGETMVPTENRTSPNIRLSFKNKYKTVYPDNKISNNSFILSVLQRFYKKYSFNYFIAPQGLRIL